MGKSFDGALFHNDAPVPPAGPTVTGSNRAHRVTTDLVWNPRYGWTAVELWEGPKAPMLALYQAYAIAGYQTRIGNIGPRYRLQVSLGFDSEGGAEVPLDRWSIDMERAQVSIWQNEAVISAMVAAATGQTVNLGGGATRAMQIADVKYLITQSVERATPAGVVLPSYILDKPALLRVIDLLLRDRDTYEVRRPVLSRSRTFSSAYLNRMRLDPVQKFYSQSRLVVEFSVPAFIQNQLPSADPGVPPANFKYGWMLMVDRVEEIPAIYKVQETKDWVYGLWPADTFTEYVP